MRTKTKRKRPSDGLPLTGFWPSKKRKEIDELPDECADEDKEDARDEEVLEDEADDVAGVEQLKMSPLTPETIEAGYISALMDLWLEQQSVGLNIYRIFLVFISC